MGTASRPCFVSLQDYYRRYDVSLSGAEKLAEQLLSLIRMVKGRRGNELEIVKEAISIRSV